MRVLDRSSDLRKVRHSLRLRGDSLIPNFLQMLSQPIEKRFALPVAELLLQFVQSKMYDVVVMNLIGSNFVTQFKPEAVQQIDFLLRQARCVGAEVKNMLLTCWKEDFQHQLRLWIREAFPRESSSAGLFGYWFGRGRPQHDRR